MFGLLRKVRIFFLFLIVFLFVITVLSIGKIYDKKELSYGVTFSKKQTIDLGLGWKDIYLSILDDLKARKIRLPVYWDDVEAVPGKYDWQDMDWQLDQAGRRRAEVILAIGGRLPRWPECHFPSWAESLSAADRQTKMLEYETAAVNRYRTNPAVKAWQVENEPFLSQFGLCPKPDANFLDQEIALVHRLDSRPVIITDSGELSFWIQAAKRADIFGSTMYRDTYSTQLGSYIHYPITPAFFRFKRNLASLVANPQDWLVIELQAEPWGQIPYQYLSRAERDRTMNPQKFKEIIDFSAHTGFREFYLWGAEWWYWEMKQGRPEMWNEVRQLFAEHYLVKE